MTASPSVLTRFVRAVHRRNVALRVLERAGLGLLGGCVVATALVAVLLWRGQDAWAIAGAMLGAGTLAGALWGITRRPTPLASAAEADRQLRTADLLATAWVVRDNAARGASDDPFRQAVLAVAAERCRTLSPSSVLLHRLGVRAWGGIALAVAFVGTLAALSAGSPEAGAAASADAVALANGNARRDRASRPILEMTTESPRPQRRANQNPGDQRTFGEDSSTAPADRTPNSTDAHPPNSPNRASSGSTSGEGSADGRASTPRDPGVRHPSLSSQAEPNDIPARRSEGDPVGGAGRTARNPSIGETNAGGTRTDERAMHSLPPWAHPAWPTAAEAAARAVEAGRVADDYRDLVRGYFDRSISTARSRPE